MTRKKMLLLRLRKTLILCAGLYVGLFAVIFVFQRDLMYYPQYGKYRIDKIPSNFKEVFIKTSNEIEIKGWLHEKDFTNKKTILYLHGNSGAINDRLHRIIEFAKMDVNFLIISYRGYSDNEGSPKEKGIYEDAKSAVDFLKEMGVKGSDIFLYGESLGTGVAIETAKNRDFAGLILEAPFTSLAEVAQIMYSIFPTYYFVLDRYESIAKIEHVNSPILIFHGKNDNLIPIEMGKEIFELANEPKQMIETEDGHIIRFNKNIIGKIDEFIGKNNIKS